MTDEVHMFPEYTPEDAAEPRVLTVRNALLTNLRRE